MIYEPLQFCVANVQRVEKGMPYSVMPSNAGDSLGI